MFVHHFAEACCRNAVNDAAIDVGGSDVVLCAALSSRKRVNGTGGSVIAVLFCSCTVVCGIGERHLCYLLSPAIKLGDAGEQIGWSGVDHWG